MKNLHKRISATLLLVALANASLAQVAECDPAIGNAAATAKVKANTEIKKIDTAVKKQLSVASACVQKAGALNARKTIQIGGGFDLDLGMLQEMFTDEACNIVQNEVASATGATTVEEAQIAARNASVKAASNAARNAATTAPKQAQPAVNDAIGKAGESAPGFFDNLSCKLFNKC